MASVTHFAVLPLDIINTFGVILHDKLKHERSFLRLPHPRTGIPSLFLASQDKLMEVQAVAPSNSRSWFLGEEVVSDGKLLIVTPIDPVFLLAAILQAIHPADDSPGTFRLPDDIFEEAALKLRSNQTEVESGEFMTDVLQFSSLNCAKEALKRICDEREITPEIRVYRFSMLKMQNYFQVKVSRLATSGILEISRTTIRNLAKDGLMEDGNENLLKIAQVRTACDLLSQYLSPDLRVVLARCYDFAELDTYLKGLECPPVQRTVNSKKSKVKGQPGGGEEKKKKKTKTKHPHGGESLSKAGTSKLTNYYELTSSNKKR